MARTRAPTMAQIDKKWQARDDLRTIQAADEIRANKARLAAAADEARKQMAALKKVKAK